MKFHRFIVDGVWEPLQPMLGSNCQAISRLENFQRPLWPELLALTIYGHGLGGTTHDQSENNGHSTRYRGTSISDTSFVGKLWLQNYFLWTFSTFVLTYTITLKTENTCIQEDCRRRDKRNWKWQKIERKHITLYLIYLLLNV